MLNRCPLFLIHFDAGNKWLWKKVREKLLNALKLPVFRAKLKVSMINLPFFHFRRERIDEDSRQNISTTSEGLMKRRNLLGVGQVGSNDVAGIFLSTTEGDRTSPTSKR